MNQYHPVIATDEVGAVAGGLVRHERNGLVVPAGDRGPRRRAARACTTTPALRARLGAERAPATSRRTPTRPGPTGFATALRGATGQELPASLNGTPAGDATAPARCAASCADC